MIAFKINLENIEWFYMNIENRVCISNFGIILYNSLIFSWKVKSYLIQRFQFTEFDDVLNHSDLWVVNNLSIFIRKKQENFVTHFVIVVDEYNRELFNYNNSNEMLFYNHMLF